MFDLFTLGGSSLDLILHLPRLPQADEKLVAHFEGRAAGGLVANTACAAARLGLNTGWAGRVGDDDGGRLVLAEFKRFGVDASLAQVEPGQVSDFCIILLEPTGERTILIVPGLAPLANHGPLSWTGSIAAAVHASRFTYSMPQAAEWFSPLAAHVHRAGGRLAVDLEGSSPVTGDELLADLRQVDLVFCSRDGLELAAGTRDPQPGAEWLLGLGPELVIVTLGKEGAAAFSKDESCLVAGFQAPVVDTTGAGDCFHAAALYGLLQRWPLQSVIRFANAAAAISVQALGARGHLPTLAEVQSFLEGG